MGKETIRCKICGKPTLMLGTKRCNNCWEVERGLGEYMQSQGGQDVIRELMTDVDDWVDGECDVWDYEAVLHKHDATVEKTDEYWWSLGWRHGTMGINMDDEVHARKMAALFIELWLRGFSASFANHIVSGFGMWLDLQKGV